MLELYEPLTADCNQLLLRMKMLARLMRKKIRSLNYKEYDGHETKPSNVQFT
jgi:hypothetical protein